MQKVTWEEVGAAGNELLSPAYKSNGHVFTSGSVGFAPDGTISEDVSVQTKYAIEALENVLKKSGSSLDKVLKVLLFISNREDAAAVNAVYKQYFKTQPGRSCVIVQFPDARIKVELECVAVYE
ncbi:hypothetical protein OGAPHI_003158 [Ogataea philodendri]|uniref:Uncharacterized protein n=1 Tax=Ogataea philodendri TaxID=1378263 RepID=A0A9P8P9Q7_9ASCO|nr:uncharacterized protein OGAPHI_003158 [Ogataea philodendri]KAH3667509.1 hypothetical protein OGAPHI_003158 [Ogataea philodendri]